MPEFDAATGMVHVPLWITAALAACAAVLCLVAFQRGGGRVSGGLGVIAAVALGVGLIWAVHDRLAVRDRADERRALDARLADLSTRNLSGNPAIACLAANAGAAVEAACEKALFAGPEYVAAAVAYAEARLALLSDAVDFAKRGNDYTQGLAILRRPVEADRFGIYAHALAARPGCSAGGCAAAALVLRDTGRILANLKDGTFEGLVGRYAQNWGQPAAGGPALAGGYPAQPAATSGAVTTADFPSAASIPPISIMNNEPGMPGQNGVDNEAKPAPTPKPAPQARRAPQPRAAETPRRPAETPGFPVPIAPQ
jgi:hypothetical protein